MPTPTQHESKRKLLDAAFYVIRSKGYSATRVEDICEAAGVTKGSFFHHFSSKEELALEAAEHWNTVTSELFAGASFHAPQDPLDRLLAYVDFRKALLAGDLPNFTCLVGTMVQEVYATWPAIREACETSIFGHAATLEPDIQAAMEKYGVHGDWTASSLALYTQAVLQGSFILAKAHGGPEVAAQSVDHLHRYLELLFGRTKTAATNSQSQEETAMTPTQTIRLTEMADTKQWSAMYYVFIERVGNIMENAPRAWNEVHRLVPQIAQHNQITGYMSLYKMDEGVYRAGVSLAAKPQHLPAGLRCEKYAGGKFHRYVLTGPFAHLPEATGLAVARAREQHLPLRNDFNIEYYVTDPRVTPEDQLITEILFPAA
ncbi:MAG TPA: TetR family transcriptional regulator [Acidobacteriaceae bacterium]|jgi:TetR/AcrR family transcriptional repressor of nem operon|nr:TetR family transcriptional regulator [Acidobacteriaceae bacterium]